MHKIKLCEICLLYFEINLNSKSDCMSKRSLAEINFRNIFGFLPDLGLTNTNTNNLFSIKHYKQCLKPQYTWKYTMKALVNTVYRRANGILNKIYKVPPFKPRVL